MDVIPVFYDELMLADSDSFSPSAGKPRPVLVAWELAGFPLELRSVMPATIEELCAAHDPRFVRAILNCQEDNGFQNRRPDVARSLPFTTGAMMGAASLALQAGIACAPVSGFHHAGYHRARGFCTFNGLMVTALKLLRQDQVRRVLILDLDQHYGDGTDDILRRLQVEGIENNTFGKAFSTSDQADAYLEALDDATRRFGEFDLILYQAGADVHVDDPLGGVLNTEQMRERDRRVFAAARRAGVPLAWDLAGGYQDPVSKVVALHVNTMRECVDHYVESLN